MATVTLQALTVAGPVPRTFEIDELSFARSIVRQGKGARRAWRRTFELNRQTIPESDAVLKWNSFRSEVTLGCVVPLHSIRQEARRRMAERQIIEDAWRPIEEQSAPGADDR